MSTGTLDSSSIGMAPPAAPSGGRVIALVALVHGQSHFFHLILAPLFPWLLAEFGFSYAQLGLLVTTFFVISGVGQSIAGFVVDRYGPVKALMAALACFAIGALLLATADAYWQLALGMAIAGAGNAPFHPIDFSIINSRVQGSLLGRAYAIHGISGNLGWAAAPAFLVGIATLSGNWRVAYLAAAALATVLLLLVIWQRRLLDVPRRTAEQDKTVGDPHATPGSVQKQSAFAFLRVRAVWLSFLFFAVYAFSLGGVQTFAPAAAGVLHQMTPATVGFCLSVYMVASAIGMLPGGFIAASPERAERLIAVGFGGAAIASLSMLLVPWPGAWVPAIFAVMGFSAGFANPSRDLLVKRATPPGATGRVYGVVYSGLDVGMALAPAFFGVLMDRGRPDGVWIAIVALQVGMIGFAFVAGAASRPGRNVAPQGHWMAGDPTPDLFSAASRPVIAPGHRNQRPDPVHQPAGRADAAAAHR
ncbi:MAG: MFS transporter [Burkholderiaceae bacterium]